MHAADEQEREVIDVFTVAGYEQIVAVWQARDDVVSVLGRRAWKTLFPAMCEGRLKPTPWLNKVDSVIFLGQTSRDEIGHTDSGFSRQLWYNY